jgi:hypothetical protein
MQRGRLAETLDLVTRVAGEAYKVAGREYHEILQRPGADRTLDLVEVVQRGGVPSPKDRRWSAGEQRKRRIDVRT